MARILDDYGRPGWMLDDLGRPEGEWELEALRRQITTPDFEPLDCNSDTLAKKIAYAKYPGRSLGEKMDAFYESIPKDEKQSGVTNTCEQCGRKWNYRWYWHTCPDCARRAT